MTFLLSRPEPVMRYPSVRLITYTVIKPIYSGVPVRISWTELYLDLLRWERGFSSFRRKNEAKRFPESFSSLPWTRILCPMWRVEEISILIGLHVSLQHNSPGDISLRFHWSCWYSSPKSAYALSANRSWTHRPQCNRQDNVRLCKP